MPQLNRIELHQANFFIGILLAFVAIFPVVYLEIVVLPYFFIGLTLLSTAAVFPRMRLAVPSEIWRSAPLFLVLTFVVDLAVFSGLAGTMEALIRLNILLVCYRAIAFRKRRDDPQLILVSLFLVIIVAVNIVSVFFILQILVFAALSMILLFNANLLGNTDRNETPEEIFSEFSWRHFLAKLSECTDFRLFGLAVGLFAIILALSAGIFLLIPRLNLENKIGFLGVRNTGSIAGFSDRVGLSDITDIQNDHRTALRIEPPSRSAVPGDPYWRMLVLDHYFRNRRTGEGRFTVSEVASTTQVRFNDHEFSPGDMDWESPDRNDEANGSWLFYLEGGVSKWLPLAGDFGSLQVKGHEEFVHVPPFRILSQAIVNSQLFFYQVDEMQFEDRYFDPFMEKEDWTALSETLSARRLAHRSGPMNYRAVLLDLPMSQRDRTYLHETVERITGGEQLDAEAFAHRAGRYLRENHEYSLSNRLPPGEGDPIVRWLRNDSPGHCEFFAGAMILLSRAAGHPARMVTGFRGGRWNSYENYLMVRFSDAHAWSEIYDGDDTWFRVDATPSGSNGGTDTQNTGDSVFGIGIDDSWMAFLDSLRVLWYRRIVSFDETSQRNLAGAVKDRMEILRAGIEDGLATFGETVKSWFRGPWDAVRILQVSGILAIVAAAIYLLRRLGWRLFPYVDPRHPRIKLDPVRRQAGVLLYRLEQRRARTEGGRSVAPEEVMALRGELQALRYGSPAVRVAPGRVFRRARTVLKRLRRR